MFGKCNSVSKIIELKVWSPHQNLFVITTKQLVNITILCLKKK